MIENTTDKELELLLIATELFYIYDSADAEFGPDDIYPLWVSIMDSCTHEEYIDALTQLAGC